MSVDPGAGYRLLRHGEIVLEGDEHFDGSWVKTWGLGSPFDEAMVPHRRVVTSGVEDNGKQKFATGAVRGLCAERERYDLVSHIGLRRLAETYGEGSVKYDKDSEGKPIDHYGQNNWLKGIPADNLLRHAIKHIEQYRSGDVSEDHLAHATWNLFSLMHFEETRPDMMAAMPLRMDGDAVKMPPKWWEGPVK